MGPITLFDKSFLQMLNPDQAALFDGLFSAVICPIFLTEAVAGLSKNAAPDRRVEKIVADLAGKTPAMHSNPTMLHTKICHRELAGQPIEMRGVPVVGGGRVVRHEGKLGLIHDETSEAKAVQCWQEGRFHSVERDFAQHWRGRVF